jgi:membrane associated rhomboid family serine protease
MGEGPQVIRRAEPGEQVALHPGRRLFTPAVTVLLVLHLAGFLSLALLPERAAARVLSTFGLRLGAVFGGLAVWQMVTHSFLHFGGCSVWGLIWTGLLLVFLGSRLEKEWGTARFACFYVVMAAGTGTLRALPELRAGIVLIGALGFLCGLLAAFGVTFRSERVWVFLTTVPVPHFVIGALVVLFLVNLSHPANVLWLTGAPLGLVYARAAFRWEWRRRPVRADSNRFAEIDFDD